MAYNFDETIDRCNTNSVKWNFNQKFFGTEDLIPMWVADMDFPVPELVTKAIIERAKHPIYGYSTGTAAYYQSVIDWMKKRHNWSIERDWITFSPGVVPSLSWIVRAFTHPGDKVIIQTPVYYPFLSVVKNNGCQLVENPLKQEAGKYVMDFEDLEKKLDSRVKLLFLCSPHNPVGRVWTLEELTRLGELCIKNNTIIVSDEIHFDLVYKGHKHTIFGTISEEFAQNSIICTAPSKTFNIAGLQVSNIIIPNPKLRNDFANALTSNAVITPNTFGIVAAQAAYQYGEEWLEAVLDYLEDNLNYLIEYTEKYIPKIKVIKPEGTYLVWMDFSSLGMNSLELKAFTLNKIRVAFDDGYIFGKNGEGFERINIACSRSIMEEALERIRKAVDEI